MNKTLTIAAIVMFAVVIGMSAMTPAMAAKVAKTTICVYDPDTDTYETASIPSAQVTKFIANNPGTVTGPCA